MQSGRSGGPLRLIALQAGGQLVQGRGEATGLGGRCGGGRCGRRGGRLSRSRRMVSTRAVTGSWMSVLDPSPVTSRASARTAANPMRFQLSTWFTLAKALAWGMPM